MATTYLQRTVSTTGSRRKATFSAWIKKSGQGEQWFLNSGGNNSTGYNTKIGFGSTDEIFIINFTSGTNLRYQTTRLLRDRSAWYHIVVVFDTDNSTSGDRVKVYINGNRETSFFNVTTPSQNLDLEMNQNTSSKNLMAIGTRYNTGDLFDGLMSHVHWCDGYAYDASAFGSTDSVTGEWKINTSPSVTYGTNGFFILKDDNAVTDRSGQGNNFTLGAGTLTKTEDSPSSVFNTFNANFQEGGGVLSNGNTTYYNASTSNWYTAASNLAASVGKYYCELKITDATNNMVGVGDMQYLVARGQNSLTHIGALNPGGVGLYNDNGEKYLQGSNTTYAASYGDGDILSIALDMDNDKVYFAKNGDWSTGSGAWGSSTFDAAVGAITLPTTNATYGFASSQRNGAKAEWNFGNGYFGTTAVSSAGTNASGNGIFEYNVPANFTALSTKGLNL